MRPKEFIIVLFLLAFILLLIPGSRMGECDEDNATRYDELIQGAKPCSIDRQKRPFVLLSRTRLKELKREIIDSPQKRRLYETTVRMNAERWVARDIQIPAPAGHYHHFVCDDGTRLIAPKNEEMGTTGPFRCPACGKTYSGERYESALRYYEHTWLMNACRDLALAGAIEGEKRYSRKAAEILRKYADAYPGRHTTVTQGGLFYQSLDESMNIISLAQAYDLLLDSIEFSEADQEHIQYDLFWECAEGLSKMGARGNWGSWHLSAVGILGLSTKHQRYIDYALHQFKRQISEELGSDGLWPESVHTYHYFPLKAFLAYAEASTNTGTDLFRWATEEGKGLGKMLVAPLSYMYPNLQLPAINDGWYNSFVPLEQYEQAYYRYRLPEFAWVLKKGRELPESANQAGAATSDTINALLFGIEIPDTAPDPVFQSTDFGNIGICTLRTRKADQEIMMTFDYGRMLGHGQLDKMGVTLFSNDRVLAADYGTPSYGSPVLPYYLGTSSHNTVVVDEKNQEKTQRAEITAFSQGSLFQAASAITDEAYPGVQWRRTVILLDDYAVIEDRLSSQEPHTYDWFFHSEGDSFDLSGGAIQAASPALGYSYLTHVREYDCPGEFVDAFWRFADNSALRVLAHPDPGTVVFAAQCPAETAVRTIPLLIVRKKGFDVRFVSVLQPVPSRAFIPSLSMTVDDRGNLSFAWDKSHDKLILSRGAITVERIQDGENVIKETVEVESTSGS